MFGFKTKRRRTIFISHKKCISCEHCVKICRHKVLGMTYNDIGGYASVEYADRCDGCNICAMLCPVDAIEIKTNK